VQLVASSVVVIMGSEVALQPERQTGGLALKWVILRSTALEMRRMELDAVVNIQRRPDVLASIAEVVSSEEFRHPMVVMELREWQIFEEL
jgi:hypothetical protein